MDSAERVKFQRPDSPWKRGEQEEEKLCPRGPQDTVGDENRKLFKILCDRTVNVLGRVLGWADDKGGFSKKGI